ncbi:type IV pilus biogenesis protein PilM [Oceanobacillus halotolerans]|uniref:type IV pilus biogenesis protein PilM n=1 Tax=Oceanobacillus halotolerans TaxID=2663380 RepID=UPI0013DADE71|nr:pilus assembly protein PilM [Oceanobacillus halotolerans]
MYLFQSGKVSIVITNRVLRYAYHKNASNKGLVTHGEVELPEGTIQDGKIVNKSVLLEVVNKLVQKYRWKRKKLYFAVPDDTVVIRQLQIPASLSKEEAVAYVHTQLGNNFYLPFGNPSLAVEFLEMEGEQRNILVLAYPKDKINAFADVFDDAGLKPVVADLTSLSVYRYYYDLYHQSDINDVLHVHWNQDALVLTAFQNHKAIFTRYMKLDMTVELNEGSAEQVINEYLIEINRIIDFYRFSVTKGESTISLLLLTGDFPYLQSAQQSLEESNSIKIHQFPEELAPTKYIDVLGLALKKEI